MPYTFNEKQNEKNNIVFYGLLKLKFKNVSFGEKKMQAFKISINCVIKKTGKREKCSCLKKTWCVKRNKTVILLFCIFQKCFIWVNAVIKYLYKKKLDIDEPVIIP